MTRQSIVNRMPTDLMDPVDHSNNKSKSIPYGRLVLLGTNGAATKLANYGQGHKSLDLHQLSQPNGVTPGPMSIVSDTLHSMAVQNPQRHAISYEVNKTSTCVVEYVANEEVDMFQIGRYKSPVIDFHIGDQVIPAASRDEAEPPSPGLSETRGAPNGFMRNLLHFAFNNNHNHGGPSGKLAIGNGGGGGGNGARSPSTISRFACRIDIDRKPPHTARIYAAGFDQRKNIFLGTVVGPKQAAFLVTLSGVNLDDPSQDSTD